MVYKIYYGLLWPIIVHMVYYGLYGTLVPVISFIPEPLVVPHGSVGSSRPLPSPPTNSRKLQTTVLVPWITVWSFLEFLWALFGPLVGPMWALVVPCGLLLDC